MKSFSLSNNKTIPSVGLGTWRSEEDGAYQAVLHGLKSGYRHIDTAAIYKNEVPVGRAIARSQVPREEIFVTTKLWNNVHTEKDAAKALDESLTNLGLDYVDLYLVHWPVNKERVPLIWQGMEKAQQAGKTLSLGVSNFRPHHIAALLKTAKIRPVVNQVECHVWLQEWNLQEYCREEGILLEAYAPLGSDKIKELLEDSTLVKIAGSHQKTVPQVALRWFLQRGIVPLPKSSNESRIQENAAIFDFELTQGEMEEIRLMCRGRRTFPDPDNFGVVYGN